MNVNHLYFLFEENMMKSLNFQTHIFCKDPPIFFILFFQDLYFFRVLHEASSSWLKFCSAFQE
jgi:hypothetical protein